ncbi:MULTISPECIES: cytochrome P450 [Microbacterium]|uniref:Cytochrome P450 n=1 Tax=Microbacterium wangchenii TaxID=2541726 RepID=A0ABX5SSK8_9MICO|nr:MULTISPECIES: cytochrome P450 [Microbacterium]MCK6066885.1 cytochrome P450 [Microbacterium sp. EYE_512]QBR88191.1 cytochrome P450 [Microbacterium wangchenii]TXK18019.1 cytochrome P450 [Microbacterium wangchenii]
MPTITPLLHDDSVSLLTRGYGFGSHIWRRARRGARAVPFRLLGRDALLVRGGEGVELFYDETRVRRHGAMPAFIQQSLFGKDSVHSLDGDEHRHRKATFLDVAYDDAQVARLTPLFEEEWRGELDAWLAGGTRSAYEAAVGAFGRASMRWAGIPGTAAAQTRWATRQAQIVDGFGVPYSPEYLLTLLNRRWSDRHAERLIEAVRSGMLHPAEGTALAEWAAHRDPSGALLPPRVAAVELQNSFRPMIAVSRFVAFAAKELHDRPEWRERIAAESGQRGTLVGGELATMFAQEIRRTAPFVPVLPAWAITDVELDGERLAAGGRVVLDILGTDTDEQSWERPDEFDPERFRGVADYEALTAFVPHGGADPATGHRCPGEKLAIAGLATAIAALSDPRIGILDAGLGVNRRRMPTKPASGGRVRAAASPSGSRCPFH